MNINWCNLPDPIWRKIFEYDSTYHDYYSNLINEFKEKTSFWRIKWSIAFTCGKCYVQKQISVLQLIQYFEKDSCRFGRHGVECTDLFITDEECNRHCKLLKHLKDTKGYIWNKEQKALYKPVKM
jgi:hypothetical protein